jgi:hypothetical protein
MSSTVAQVSDAGKRSYIAGNFGTILTAGLPLFYAWERPRGSLKFPNIARQKAKRKGRVETMPQICGQEARALTPLDSVDKVTGLHIG